jgi:AcrR family transcriptional regulator
MISAMAQPRSAHVDPGRPLLPGRADSDGTHRRLLEAALIRFGDRGYHGVSVREIADAAGIRASSLYSHLESKEQILFELMLVGHDEHHNLMRQALLESGSDPVEQIEHLVNAHVSMHATYPLLGRVCNRELASLGRASREKVIAVRRQSEQLLSDVIDRGVRLGVFAVPDPWLAAAAIAGMGVRVAEWWNDDLPYRVEQVASTYSEFSLRLLNVQTSG